MTNNLTAASPTYWNREAGKKLYKTTMYRSITEFVEGSQDGLQFDRPYRNDIVAENYTPGSALTAQDLTYTSDILTANQYKSLLFYVDAVHKIQNKYDSVKLWAEEAGERLAILLDADILYEAINANNDLDASDLGGVAGEGIQLSASNVAEVFALANEELDINNVPEGERYMVLSPLFYKYLWTFIGGKETDLGDKTSENGMIGTYAGMKLFKSNNVTGEARWTPANNPSNTDTITIEGITFTFVSTIGSTAGNILIGGSLAATLDNLVALINNGGASSDSGVSNVSLSAANQKAVQQWVAVDGATYVVVRIKGTSSLTVTGSEAGDTWDAKYINQNIMAGRKRAISAVIQTSPVVSFEMASTVSAGKRGVNVMPLLTYGKKVYDKGKRELVKISIRTDS